ncbi:MAG TPA: hypothetical protein VHH32_03045, partial [Gemmatimonadales bacterium]|nr:hypothetical protein [Gemmatimonadales bacterium]
MTVRLCSIAGAAGLVLLATAALPVTVDAQFGGSVNVGTGPMAWDHTDARDPLFQGAMAANYRMPLLFGLRPELIAELGLSSEPDRRTAIRWDFAARLHTTGDVAAAWLGAAIGEAGVGRTTGLTRLEGGISRAIGPAGLELWMSRTRLGAGILPGGRLGLDSGLIDTLNVGPTQSRATEYTEVGSRATIGLGRYDLGLMFLRRFGAASVRRTGWELTGTWWLAPSIGLVGATGRSLPQFGLAIPGGRYGTVGFRLALGRAGKPEGGKAGKPAGVDGVPRLEIAGRRLTLEWAAPARAA